MSIAEAMPPGEWVPPWSFRESSTACPILSRSVSSRVANGRSGAFTVVAPNGGEFTYEFVADEAAIGMYLNNAELRHRHGMAARERVRQGFDPAELWGDFYEYYLHLLRREGLEWTSVEPPETPFRRAA